MRTIGSGNWTRVKRKYTVEESLALGMGDFRGRLSPNAAGTFTWTWADGDSSSIGYNVCWVAGVPIIDLAYRWRNTEDVSISIRLETTPTQFGGERWWFNCPMIVAGVACNRRAGKLYLPPGAKCFGCRLCHGLTYRSCQEAHQAQRFFNRVAGLWS